MLFEIGRQRNMAGRFDTFDIYALQLFDVIEYALELSCECIQIGITEMKLRKLCDFLHFITGYGQVSISSKSDIEKPAACFY